MTRTSCSKTPARQRRGRDDIGCIGTTPARRCQRPSRYEPERMQPPGMESAPSAARYRPIRIQHCIGAALRCTSVSMTMDYAARFATRYRNSLVNCAGSVRRASFWLVTATRWDLPLQRFVGVAPGACRAAGADCCRLEPRADRCSQCRRTQTDELLRRERRAAIESARRNPG